ncbi:hypothetical protein EGW08_001896, partial [Elysia chlorotica]
KPKVITIVRSGPKPRANVKILLNRRSVQSYEQLVTDISEAFGPKHRHAKIRRLFSVRGKEVHGISDFFRDDDCFIAVSVGEANPSDADVGELLEEIFPEGNYAKVFQREWEKNQRRSRRSVAGSLKSNRDAVNTNAAMGKYEAERRAAEDEKRKRGLVPPRNMENPFKKTEDPRDKEREEAARRKREEERRRREEERMEQEKKEKEREEREQAERAARERMQQAEQKEKEAQEKDRLEQEERDRKKKEKDDKAQRKAEKASKAKDGASGQNDASPGQKQDAAQTKDKQRESDATTAAPETSEPATAAAAAAAEDAEMSEAAATTAAATAPVAAAAAAAKDQAASQRQQQKEKRRQEREEKQQRKRAKTKIVRKTKEERQVASDDYILERYDLGRKLGDGNFAVVRQSRKKETGQEFAVKVIDKAKLKGKEHMVENEIDIMKDCNHANIVRLFEEYETAERIYLVMELVKWVSHFKPLGLSALMVKDLCNALYYMHSRSIVHRDLKPENLLVHRNKDGSITLKLADFGLAMEVKELIYTVCGTPTYVAPEILTEVGYGLEVDMWAVGVITYILLCGFPPFRSPDRNQTELFEFIKAGEYEFLSPYWDSTSKSAKDLISRLLIVDRRKRFTSVDVLSHKWVVSNGQPETVPDGAPSLDAACKKTRRELEDQAKVNYDSYQRHKAEKRKERERIRGEE